MLARLGGMLYRARWIAIFVVLVIVAGAAILGSGLFGVLKSGGVLKPASRATKGQSTGRTLLWGRPAGRIIPFRKESIARTPPRVHFASTQLISRHEKQ